MGGFQNAILKIIFVLLVTVMITNSNLEGMSLFSILEVFFVYLFALFLFYFVVNNSYCFSSKKPSPKQKQQ